jgi:hypothetical protein
MTSALKIVNQQKPIPLEQKPIPLDKKVSCTRELTNLIQMHFTNSMMGYTMKWDNVPAVHKYNYKHGKKVRSLRL